MKTYRVNGSHIKRLREQLRSGATQKEVAFAVGISERQLRKIENCGAIIKRDALERLARHLGVAVKDIAYAIDGPRLVPSGSAAEAVASTLFPAGDYLQPRYDTEYASATGGPQLSRANSSARAELVCVDMLPVSEIGARMVAAANLVEVAALVGDTARATMLNALMGGQSLTATELAYCASISRSTASGHLSKLVAARLLTVIRNRRFSYYRIASPLVATMLESIKVVAAVEVPPRRHSRSANDDAPEVATITWLAS